MIVWRCTPVYNTIAIGAAVYVCLALDVMYVCIDLSKAMNQNRSNIIVYF